MKWWSRFGKTRLWRTWTARRLRRLAEQDGEEVGAAPAGRDQIQYVRSIFKFAYDAGLIDRPVRFGPGLQAAVEEDAPPAPGQAGPEAVHG